MGIGMVWFVPRDKADEALKICKEYGYEAAVCGEVTEGCGKVEVK